jgi:hypothetical protein
MTEVPRVVAIHVAPGTRLPMKSVDRVVAEAGKGLVGDRYHGTRHRHVSVQSATALAEAAEIFGAPIAQEALRRRGGSIFRVLEGGEIGLGVAVVPEPGPTD